jgi:hypothetical protein
MSVKPGYTVGKASVKGPGYVGKTVGENVGKRFLLRDETDERIEMALEEMMEKVT